jgi:hypothetical protein
MSGEEEHPLPFPPSLQYPFATMDTSPARYLYRALRSLSRLVALLDESIIEIPEVQHALNICSYHLFVMYWMSVDDRERVDAMRGVNSNDHPRFVMNGYGLEALPRTEASVPMVDVNPMFMGWFQEKSENAIRALAAFAAEGEYVFSDELYDDDVLDQYSSLLENLGQVYHLASEEPLFFCQSTPIDRLFDQHGLSSFYQSEHKKDSKVIMRFLKLWEKIDEQGTLDKLLSLRSDDPRIRAVQRILETYGMSMPLAKTEAAAYIQQLRLGPL